MSELIIAEKSDLTAIADAIREKTGTTDQLTLPTMSESIKNLSGKRFPESMDYIESNLNPNYSIYAYGSSYIAANQGYIYTSADGRSWSSKSLSESKLYVRSIVDNFWLGYVSNTGIYYSEDYGVNWTKATGLINNYTSYNISRANNIWYCGLTGGNNTTTYTYYSLDGKSWSVINSLPQNFTSITYASGVYFTHTSGNAPVYRSTDGINWSVIDEFNKSASIMHLCWHKGRWFMKHGWDSSHYSEDGGLTWVEITDNPMHYMITNGEILIGYNRPDYDIYRSTDGLTWEPCGINVGNTSTKIQCVNGMWFIMNFTNTTSYLSLDSGKTWHSFSSPTGCKGLSQVWSDGLTLFMDINDQYYQSKYYYTPLFE